MDLFGLHIIYSVRKIGLYFKNGFVDHRDTISSVHKLVVATNIFPHLCFEK
jgi:hypothetical protein